MLQGYATESDWIDNSISTLKGDYLGSARYTLNNALFLTSLGNLEWSRGYLWFVELDDVPFPFQRNGVLGLPVINCNYDIVNGNKSDFGGFERYPFPLNRGGSNHLSMTLYDDEKGTITGFFERWYNNVYNSRGGVLPVVEACKCISIYKLKCTRARLTRYSGMYDPITQRVSARQQCKSRDFLIFPTGELQETFSNDNNVRTITVQFEIAMQLNPDYGNPANHEGVWETALGGKLSSAANFLKKASSFF